MPLHFNLISMKSYEKKRELITYVLLFIHLFFDQSQWTLSYENRIEDKFKIGNSFSQADNNLDEFDLIELERVSNSRVLITPSLKVIILVSLDNVVSPIVCIFSGFLQQKFGPRTILMVTCIPYFLSWLAAVMAGQFYSIELLYLSRFVEFKYKLHSFL